MKLLLVFLLSLSAHAIITPIGSNSFDNEGVVSGPELIDIKVKFTSAVAAGDVVVWDTTAANGYTVESTAIQAVGAGDAIACVSVSAQAAGSIGRCRVFGAINVNHSGFGSNLTAGGAVFASPDDLGGKVTGITTPAGTDFKVGTSMAASSATESVLIFVNVN